MRYPLLPLLLLLQFSLGAQLLFRTTLGLPANRTELHAVAEWDDGDVAAVGRADDPATGTPTCFAVRHSSDGTQRWVHRLRDEGQGLDAYAALARADGSLLVVATREDDVLILLRIGASGEPDVLRRLRPDMRVSVYRMLPTGDGGLVLGGQGQTGGQLRFSLLSLSAELELGWQRHFVNVRSPDEATYCDRLLEYPNGDILATGRSGGVRVLYRLGPDNTLRYGAPNPGNWSAGQSLGEWYLNADGAAEVPGGGFLPGRVSLYRVAADGAAVEQVLQAPFLPASQSRAYLNDVRVRADGTYEATAHNRDRSVRLAFTIDGEVLDTLHSGPRLPVVINQRTRQSLRLRGGGYLVSENFTNEYGAEAARLHYFDADFRAVWRTDFGADRPSPNEQTAALAAAPDGESLALAQYATTPGRPAYARGFLVRASGSERARFVLSDPDFTLLVATAQFHRDTWWVLVNCRSITDPNAPGFTRLYRYDRAGRPLGAPIDYTDHTSIGGFITDYKQLFPLSDGRVLLRGVESRLLLASDGTLLDRQATAVSFELLRQESIVPDATGGFHRLFFTADSDTLRLSHHPTGTVATNSRTFVVDYAQSPFYQSHQLGPLHQLTPAADESGALWIVTRYPAADYALQTQVTRVEAGDLSTRALTFPDTDRPFPASAWEHRPFDAQAAPGIGLFIHTNDLTNFYSPTGRLIQQINRLIFSSADITTLIDWYSSPRRHYYHATDRRYQLRTVSDGSQTDLRLSAFGYEHLRLPTDHAYATSDSLTLYPNPARYQSNLRWHSSYRGPITVDLYAPNGQALQRWTRRKEWDIFSFALPLAPYPAGNYLLQLSTPGERLLRQLVIVH